MCSSSVLQCVAVRSKALCAAVCGSAEVCGSARCSVWQCAQRCVAVQAGVCGCPAVQRCVAVRQFAQQCAAVQQCSVWQGIAGCGRVQQCAAGQRCAAMQQSAVVRTAMCGSACDGACLFLFYNYVICFCFTITLFVFKYIR
jgi:hypothetical protein